VIANATAASHNAANVRAESNRETRGGPLRAMRCRRGSSSSSSSSSDDRINVAAESNSVEEVAALFARSLELAVRVQDTIRNLRDFAHADEFIMKPIALPPALMDVADMVRRLAESKAVEVQCDLAADVPAVNGNAGKLKKVVLHLLVNAIDAVDRRGDVVLRLANKGDHVQIQVQDNGRGIAPTHLQHIFEPFSSLRYPADRRMGLGLAISDAIIREHGGTLEVNSTLGHGTTFTIRLPSLHLEFSVPVQSRSLRTDAVSTH
jgi:signal transduction histidine kinase